ncbi:unnamed protein product, partial [Rotaria socialis]
MRRFFVRSYLVSQGLTFYFSIWEWTDRQYYRIIQDIDLPMIINLTKYDCWYGLIRSCCDIERDITALAHNNQLIVVFDPAGANGNLKDAIAAAILKRIYFRREKNASSKYKSLAMELKWCLVWDKVDHARQNVFATHIFENISTSHTIQEF